MEVFFTSMEVLPDTERTAALKRKKLELIRKRREDQENEKKRKEQEEAAKRLREQEAKKQKALAEQRKKEEERRKREEEEQRAKMEGGLNQLLGQLTNDTSNAHVSACGIDLNSVQLRLLSQALEANTSCMCLDL